MARYRLSSKAESDLFHIALYGLQEFGLTQSERYRDQLNARFAEIAETPLLYPAVEHIRAGHRRSVCGAHAIYYRIRADHVEIIRVIGQQDF